MILNANLTVKHKIQIKNGIIKHVNMSVKIIITAKKDYSKNPCACIRENTKSKKALLIFQ